MGQQQLLLVILGIIVVGIAVSIGIHLFRVHAIDEKRDLLTDESINIATIAINYYKRPTSFGGGGRSFTGWEIPVQVRETAAGNYTAAIYSDSVVITGIGNETVTDNDSVEIKISVYPNSYRTTIVR